MSAGNSLASTLNSGKRARNICITIRLLIMCMWSCTSRACAKYAFTRLKILVEIVETPPRIGRLQALSLILSVDDLRNLKTCYV